MLLTGSLKHQLQLLENPWFFTLPMHFGNYTIAVGQIIRPIFNSIIITTLGITFALIGASLASYVFAIYKFPGKTFFYYYIIFLLMVPGFVILIPQFMVVNNLGMFNTYLGQVLPPVANNIAMGTLLMTTFFRGLSKSVIESAQIEGCNEIQLFTKIVLPLSKPILATISITTGLVLWNNFIWPLVITQGDRVAPVIVVISRLRVPIVEGLGPVFAAYVVAALPILILFAFASKAFVTGLTAGAVKG
jgi:ABC-type glycerol-3-phosphate transport system permease component